MIKSGTTIHTEKPFVHVLSSNFRNIKCDNCYAECELLSCSGCRYVKYCDKNCQKSSWIHHKNECNIFKLFPTNKDIPNTARLLYRIICKLKKGGDQEKGYYNKDKFRFFKDLISHYSDIKEDKKRTEHSISLYGVLKDLIGEDNLPNFSEFTGIYGRVVVNSFNILDSEMNTLGTGIYLGASTIDHSCEPNAIALFSGTTITIRTIKDIPEYKWSKVRISYIEQLKCTESRRSMLNEQYYFLCDCERCNSISNHNNLETSIICQNCLAPVPCKNDEAQCLKCDWTVSDELVTKYNEIVKFTKELHNTMDDIAYLDACKMCLLKQKDIFHKDNLYYVKTLDLAFDAAIHLNMWDDSLAIGDELVQGYRKYYGDIHPVLGLHYMKFGKILLLKNKYDKALTMLEKAQTILNITHGCDHELYRVQLYRLIFDAKSCLYSI